MIAIDVAAQALDPVDISVQNRVRQRPERGSTSGWRTILEALCIGRKSTLARSGVDDDVWGTQWRSACRARKPQKDQAGGDAGDPHVGVYSRCGRWFVSH